MSLNTVVLIRLVAITLYNMVRKTSASWKQVVYYYNHKYSRDGHLFRERFKSEPVNDMSYFVTLLRYIHQNPLKAGIVDEVQDYEFSSWGEYIDPNRHSFEPDTIL